MTNLLGRRRITSTTARSRTPTTPVYGPTDHIENLADHLNALSFGMSRIADQAPQSTRGTGSVPTTPQRQPRNHPRPTSPRHAPLLPVSPLPARRSNLSPAADAVPTAPRVGVARAQPPTVVVYDSDSDLDIYGNSDVQSDDDEAAPPPYEQLDDGGVPGQGPVSSWRVWPGSRRIDIRRRFYVVTVGRVCGVFNINWLRIAPLCKPYTSGTWHRFETIEDAWDHYTDAYRLGDVHVIHRTPGNQQEEERFGPFDRAIQVPHV